MPGLRIIMKTKIQISSTLKVKEESVEYKAGSCNSDILLWVVNSDGSILIKKPHRHKNKCEICELTIDANSIGECMMKLEKEAGILCEKSKVHKVYSHSYSPRLNKQFDVYFLTINLDSEHKEVVEDRFGGKFIDYRELMTHLGESKISSECKEALLNLISVLYDKYSYL